MTDETKQEVPGADRNWIRVYEKGAAREARALPGPFTWEGQEFQRGDMAVREPGLNPGDLIGVYSKAEFADRFLQAAEDRDHEANLRILLYGLQQACDRVLRDQGVSPESKPVDRMSSDILDRFRRKETSTPLAVRTLANSLLALLIAAEGQDQRAKRLARREAEQGPDPVEGVDQDG